MMTVKQILELTKEFSMDELTELRLSLQRELMARGGAEVALDWSGQQAIILSQGAIPEPGENLESEVFSKVAEIHSSFDDLKAARQMEDLIATRVLDGD
jgi:hypothetical protein